MGILGASIRFPNIGIELQHLSTGFSVFGIEVRFYGLIIALGVLTGLLIAEYEARRTKQKADIYTEFLIIDLVTSIIGARLYYVILSWSYYKNNLGEIFKVREGGLAIYGAIIASVITLYFYTKIKKLSFWIMADTACLGLIAGQMIGRWGNFFNREAFGGYTDSLFAMQIKLSEASYAPVDVLSNLKIVGGIEYIQVQPTFLYESVWCLGVLILLLIYRKHKKFEGEIFFLYVLGYSLGRSWIEGLRTDQLLLPNSTIPASQVLAVILVLVSFGYIIYRRIKIKKMVV